MGDTEISWTHRPGTRGRTWNPVQGCSRISAGCQNCYAERLAARFAETGWSQGLINLKARKWNGTLRIAQHKLADPLRWREPSTVFVNSMSDLFHEGLTNEQIAAVFGVMAACPQHTFQCLTKRPARMREFLTHPEVRHWIAQARDAAIVNHEHDPRERWKAIPGFDGYEASSDGRIRNRDGREIQQYLNDHDHIGRYTVTIYKYGHQTTQFVHRLVLLAFAGKPCDGEEGCHRNGVKTDNRVANLRWGTRSENQNDKVRHGSRGGPAKLTSEQVARIRSRRAAGETQQSIADAFGVSRSLISLIESGDVWAESDLPWPLPNVWIGVSVENQDAADERIPELLRTPAAVRFLSCEPLLGAVHLHDWISVDEAEHGGPTANYRCSRCGCRREPGRDEEHECPPGFGSTIDWVIAGCESGPGARPCSVEWLRSLRDQCAAAGVAYYLKQAVETDMGTCGDADNPNGDDPCGERIRYFVYGPKDSSVSCGCTTEGSEDANGCPPVGAGDGSRRKPGGVIELPYLDGVQHAAFPEVTRG